MNNSFTITFTAEDIEESRVYCERMIADQKVREARLVEKRRLSRTKDIQKVCEDVMRFEPAIIVHEAARRERFYGYDECNLASIPTYITVLETLHRFAIETTGYHGPQDTDDPDAVRVHAAQEAQARRRATREHNKAEAARSYRAEAEAREMADPRIPVSHKTKVAAGTADPILVTDKGEFELDWNLLGPAMAAMGDNDVYRPLSKLWWALTFGGSPIETTWITALPKNTLIPFIDAVPGYIAFLHDIQRLAQTEHNTPSLRVVS
jgi:hypothetical protein